MSQAELARRAGVSAKHLNLCRAVGVVLVIEKELPKARVDGVARWLTPTRALIQLSARYLRDDILWFTFFHEAAHLLLHAKQSGPRDVPPTFIDTKDPAAEPRTRRTPSHATY